MCPTQHTHKHKHMHKQHLTHARGWVWIRLGPLRVGWTRAAGWRIWIKPNARVESESGRNGDDPSLHSGLVPDPAGPARRDPRMARCVQLFFYKKIFRIELDSDRDARFLIDRMRATKKNIVSIRSTTKPTRCRYRLNACSRRASTVTSVTTSALRRASGPLPIDV